MKEEIPLSLEFQGILSLAVGEGSHVFDTILSDLLTPKNHSADDYLSQCQVVPDPVNLRDLHYQCFQIKNRPLIMS